MSIDEALKQLLFVARKGSRVIREVTSCIFSAVGSYACLQIL